ncbi:MAG: LysM peptidoglycan-binding domain-containing protein, partial [Muribaculaceae bacterium]|nr:LysM peptidoglycan-binding domain-containing protein [Muribaculaceae bacterium]
PHLHFETRYMGYAINPMAIFDFANQTTHTDTYTFTKNTYQNARNYSPEANATYAAAYAKANPRKPYTASNSSSKGGNKYTTVKKGDSLSKIASRNGTTVGKLCSLNGLKTSSKLQPGQKLRVK